MGAVVRSRSQPSGFVDSSILRRDCMAGAFFLTLPFLFFARSRLEDSTSLRAYCRRRRRATSDACTL